MPLNNVSESSVTHFAQNNNHVENLPKLTSNRLVNSISVQTNSPIPICSHQQTQTHNEFHVNPNDLCIATDSYLNSNEQLLICNVTENQNSIPLIACQFRGIETLLLADTGSSLSLLDSEFFN